MSTKTGVLLPMPQEMTAWCAFCSWHAQGEQETVMRRQRRHRERKHGFTHGQKRKIGRSLKMSYAELSREQRFEIERDIARRKRLHGVDDKEAA